MINQNKLLVTYPAGEALVELDVLESLPIQANLDLNLNKSPTNCSGN